MEELKENSENTIVQEKARAFCEWLHVDVDATNYPFILEMIQDVALQKVKDNLDYSNDLLKSSQDNERAIKSALNLIETKTRSES